MVYRKEETTFPYVTNGMNLASRSCVGKYFDIGAILHMKFLLSVSAALTTGREDEQCL